MSPRTAFLGSPASAIPTLRALAAASDLRLVVTRPDRPRGRGRSTVPTPVKVAAEDLGVTVAEPGTKGELRDILSVVELDLAVVAAYGMIIPADVLQMPRLGMVNIHYSLLPRWRGAAPVQRALLAGDRSTGITLMQMDAGLDTGPILASWETAVGIDESAGELTDRLAQAAGELLQGRLPGLLAEELAPVDQPVEGVTYAEMLQPEEARLDPRGTATDLARAIRAFDPRPGARFERDGSPFKVFAATAAGPADLLAGELARAEGGVLMGTGGGTLHIGEVQPAGKRRMEAAAWARGIQGPLGTLT